MSQIDYQLSDYQNTISSIEQKYAFAKKSIKETLNDYKLGIELLNQSLINDKMHHDFNNFKDKIFQEIIAESESIKESLRELIHLTNHCKEFQEKELILRRKFKDDPENFDETKIKELSQLKMTRDDINEQIFSEVEEMINNAKNSKFDENEDILMDAPSTQVIKCPITGKPIQDMVKNTTCDHVYERSAILHHLKSTRHKKCPYAGCRQNVFLEK